MTPSPLTNRFTELEALTRALVESNAVSAAAARDAAAAVKEAIAAAAETEAKRSARDAKNELLFGSLCSTLLSIQTIHKIPAGPSPEVNPSVAPPPPPSYI